MVAATATVGNEAGSTASANSLTNVHMLCKHDCSTLLLPPPFQLSCDHHHLYIAKWNYKYVCIQKVTNEMKSTSVKFLGITPLPQQRHIYYPPKCGPLPWQWAILCTKVTHAMSYWVDTAYTTPYSADMTGNIACGRSSMLADILWRGNQNLARHTYANMDDE